jgi:general secretion pathway protein D
MAMKERRILQMGGHLALIGLTLTSIAALAQDPLDEAFMDDEVFDEPIGTPMSPPAPGSADFGLTPPPGLPPSPPAGFPTESPGANAPSGSGSFGSPGSSFSRPSRRNSGSGLGPSNFGSSGGPGGAPANRPIGRAGAPDLSAATIDDITDENYPEIIESFDYPNAEISDIVKAISQLTRKNFILDPNVKGRITIIAPTKITVAEAYRAFLAALANNGFAVVPYGRFYKIKTATNARKENVPLYTGAYYPTADALITRIFHLRHINAEDVMNRLRQAVLSNFGDIVAYPQTNTVIITDYGSNVDRTARILAELDKPGFDEQLEVVPIRYAKAKDIADMITQIILKEPRGAGAAQQPPAFGGAPRFPGRRAGGGSGPEELSLVTPDDRTNALIVVGNKQGIAKVRELVRKLDYKLDPSEAGGVFVYYVKYGEAEKIAQTLNGIAQGSGPGGGGGGAPPPPPGFGIPIRQPGTPERQNVFGGDVRIAFDKTTNSLIITASKQDYSVVLDLLGRIDIPRDQVYVEAIIMEMNTDRTRAWNPNIIKFDPSSKGVGRIGFTSGNIASILNPIGGGGASTILGFATGAEFDLQVPGGQTTKIKDTLGFIEFIQQNLDGNILSTPQIMATDNEKAVIQVSENIPVANEVATIGNTGASRSAPKFEDAPIKLDLTPSIRAESDMVRLKVELQVTQPSTTTVRSAALNDSTTILAKRTINTNIVVGSGDTAVLGGLIRDEDKTTERKVPILGDIPVLGWFFKSSTVERRKMNLVAFLTPRIIRSRGEGQRLVTDKANERVDWIKRNFDGRDPFGKKVDSLPRAALTDEDIERPVRSSQEPIRRGGDDLSAPPPSQVE